VSDTPNNLFGIIGWKNAGKTTLVVRLVEHFTAQGLRVATVKHAHHNFDIDHPGKDSYLHREAGASQVIIASDQRIAMLRENPEPTPPTLEDTLRWVDPCDLILVEGFKRHPHPKMEVIRDTPKDEPVALTDTSVRAIATDRDRSIGALPVLDIEDIPAIADFILKETGITKK
jgi:molybdopterin-guanine dinucleotide biosynthesis adapter protein